ncbi:MAG: dockerin type I repeat-containing protein, partial [Planctomycetota bacterium]
CKGEAACGPIECCDNGEDDDGDGLVDCDDPICDGQIACGGIYGFDLSIVAAGTRRTQRDGNPVNVVDVTSGTKTLDASVYFLPVPEPNPQGTGIQGWSISVAHDSNFLEFISGGIGDTDAGLLFDNGFQRTEAANDRFIPGGGDEPTGFVSAVVLSFVENLTLDPFVPQSIVNVRYRVLPAFAQTPQAVANLEFRDGLTGSGQPVNNVHTQQGETRDALHLIGLELRAGTRFLRGDANDDSRVDLADAVWIVNDLFRGGPETTCRASADVDANGRVNLSDAIYVAHYRFLSGPRPPAPFPSCGLGEGDRTSCADVRACQN